MKIPDFIIEKSPAQKKLRVENLRIELKSMGYSIVPSDWLFKTLQILPNNRRVEAMAEGVR